MEKPHSLKRFVSCIVSFCYCCCCCCFKVWSHWTKDHPLYPFFIYIRSLTIHHNSFIFIYSPFLMVYPFIIHLTSPFERNFLVLNLSLTLRHFLVWYVSQPSFRKLLHVYVSGTTPLFEMYRFPVILPLHRKISSTRLSRILSKFRSQR